MKIPEGTEPGYYWVKYEGTWAPSLILYAEMWSINYLGVSFILHPDICDELGPSLEPPDDCPRCGGLGFEPYSQPKRDCPICHGKGAG